MMSFVKVILICLSFTALVPRGFANDCKFVSHMSKSLDRFCCLKGGTIPKDCEKIVGVSCLYETKAGESYTCPQSTEKRGLHPRMKKRVERELEKLKANGFIVSHINEDTLQEFTLSKKDRVFQVYLPEAYPHIGPIVNRMQYTRWSPQEQLLEVIEREFPVGKSLMMVYCHPKPVLLNDPHSHFQVDLFNQYLKSRQIHPTHTVSLDMAEGGTFVGDGFDPEFVYQNRGLYEVVFLPDCGGKWYTLQNERDTHGLVELIKTVARIVKPHGHLMLGKIIDEASLDTIVALLNKDEHFKAQVLRNFYWHDERHTEPYIEVEIKK
ncbi:MAG: hypothetical protein HYX41_01115 [Bdellovibrio sp.]|nr:hypothetical protein [Bdellovibrio sp.]